MASTKLERIVDFALAGTNNGQLTWRVGVDQFSFTCTLANAVLIVDSVDGDGLRPYQLSIASIGKPESILESISQRPGPEPWDTLSYPEIDELWKAARRVALDIEPVLDSVLQELQNTIEITDPANAEN